MAPEPLAGEAADLYALGCVLYEIVAGEPVHTTGRARSTPLAGAHIRERASDPVRRVVVSAWPHGTLL
jgi:serine/threonine protein kinase